MLGTLVQGRVCISAGALSAASPAQPIAIRNARPRRQFGPADRTEGRSLDYRAQQHRRMPELARSRASASKIGKLPADAVPGRDGQENWLDAEYQLDLFRWRQAKLVASVAGRFKRGLSEG